MVWSLADNKFEGGFRSVESDCEVSSVVWSEVNDERSDVWGCDDGDSCEALFGFALLIFDVICAVEDAVSLLEEHVRCFDVGFCEGQ